MPNLVTLRRMTAENYVTRYQEQARSAFASHVIRHRDQRSWVCFCPHKDGGWDSAYWFEAVVLYGGTLVVNGDIAIMHFAYYGRHENPEQVLRWIGGTRDLAYYVTQKAAIGMTLPRECDGIVDVVCPEVWMDHAIGHIEDRIGKTLDTSKPIALTELGLPEWLYDLVQDAATTDIRQILANEDLSWEAYEAGARDWGRVPSTRLINAHEALRRLVAILDQESASLADPNVTGMARYAMRDVPK